MFIEIEQEKRFLVTFLLIFIRVERDWNEYYEQLLFV
jgi:hypothetical protein